jgi:anthranilate/para-aminobenzoate synthase component II
MGIADEKQKIYGVQFHPESIASEHGNIIIQNFINLI